MLVINLVNLDLLAKHFIFLLEKKRVKKIGDSNNLGQASIPVLNRTGCYMYWLSSWDDLHSFSKRFNEDLFLRSFFENMFHRKVSTHFLY